MEPVMVETVRIPIKSNKAKSNETGFPFDDSEFDNRDRSFRTHIDDIVNRHPELAEHLNFDRNFDRFPFRSNTWGHKRRGSSSGDDSRSSRTADSRPFARPFGSNFEERFGFPFNRTFDGDPEYRKQDSHHQEKPEYKPAATPEQTESQKEKSSQENICEKPPQVPIQDRGRKQHPNIPQSNTVDLGQKQDPVYDSRGQRSMSAPPENRAGQQRFVSSINIPMKNANDGNHQPQQAKPQTTQQQQAKCHERVIPIHVEGRDEPVIPKRAGTPSQTYESERSSQPQPQRVFGQRPAGFGHWERSSSPYYTGDPAFGNESQYFDGPPQYFMNRGEPHQQRTNAEDYFTGPHKQQQQPQHEQHQKQQKPPQQPQHEQHQKPPQQPQHENVAARQATPPPQQAAPPPAPKGPIDQIKNIQKEVLQLMDQVEKFNGKPKDKQYLYLDEMLTRNLLKLDDVDTEGKDNIRQARKEAINCIQKCISILEAKAAANEQLRNELMDVDAKIENAIATNDVSTTTESAPITSLEVSGTARSGVEVQPSAPEVKDENSEMDMSQSVSEQVPEAKEEASNQDEVGVSEDKEGPEEQQKEENVSNEAKENEMKVEETPKEGENVVESTTDTSNTSQTNEAPTEEVKDKKEKKKVKKKEKTAAKTEEK